MSGLLRARTLESLYQRNNSDASSSSAIVMLGARPPGRPQTIVIPGSFYTNASRVP